MTSSAADSHTTLLKSVNQVINDAAFNASAEEYAQMSNDCDRMMDALLEFSDLKVPEPEYNQKSTKRADEFRQQGNQFLSTDKGKTLSLYTESIAHAPVNSAALGFGYANRAVCLFAMGHTMDAIADNQRAIISGYPENMLFKVLARLGKCYETLGQYDKSLKCLNGALKGIEAANLSQEAKAKFVKDQIQPTLDACHTAGEEDEDELFDWTDEPLIGILKLDVPSLGSDVNPELPCASENVVLKYNKKFGRHLVATKDFKFGDILVVEEQYAAVLMEGSFYTHCSHCLLRCRTLKPCPICSWTMFCSGKCMEEAEVYHKLECVFMPALLRLEPKSRNNATYMLTIRVVTRYGLDYIRDFLLQNKPATRITDEDFRTAGFNKDGKYDSSDINTIANLYSQPTKNYAILIQNLRKTCELMKYMRFDELDFAYELGGFMLCYYSNCIVNGGSSIKEYIVKDGGEEDNAYLFYGLGICPGLSLINQNCVSNVFSHDYGKIHVLRAFGDIKKGEQLFVTRGAVQFSKVPLETRKRLTKEVWNFECTCIACLEKWPLDTAVPMLPKCFLQERRFASVMSAIYKYQNLYDLKVTSKVISDLKKIYKTFQQSQKYQVCHYYMRLKEVIRNYYVKEGCRVIESAYFPKEAVFFPRDFKQTPSSK